MVGVDQGPFAWGGEWIESWGRRAGTPMSVRAAGPRPEQSTRPRDGYEPVRLDFPWMGETGDRMFHRWSPVERFCTNEYFRLDKGILRS
ncbi:uncharacterized protein BO80DRAFT_428828 [Aspergillus ibericus CBS 121593]|uniref:Uncharacterized protein n=1 Tax=Aspergillus ibericus CBS 121593 TaxID=1448316 RepID=A0A395GPA4_9EURO|nr:hypothetical protein BO80DRAFT_428828 [Aspergillus ibericus CBS 121593]RAK96677.1 hypothetical protein BO80DRAFT_428828 [Aspergillus ibericus CBS 121593]